MQRRVAKYSILGSFILLSVCSAWAKDHSHRKPKPNIIYIYTDQQSASMMSNAGNPWLKTPAMDYIADNSIRFTRAYTTNPVCSPARVSLMTGRFAGAFNDAKGNQVRENHGSMRIPDISPEVEKTTIAAFLKQAGYDLIYGGKEHLPKPLNPKSLGFKDICNDERDQLAEMASAFIRQNHENPYFMILSFINPHDICYMALRGLTYENPDYPSGKGKSAAEKKLAEFMRIPDGISEQVFFDQYSPPLPSNYQPQKDEPEAIMSLLKARKFRMQARETYSEKDWRLHRWAYHRLTEVVDGQVQIVLDALKESGLEENTLVLFSSDHGDMDSSHRMEHKTALYEEAANVPFMAMWKGHIPAGQVDTTHLVSNGLDLLPTICDYAGIEAVSDPRGRNLRPLFEARQIQWRETLGVESEIGRMIVDQNKLKYIRYDVAGREEQLLDLHCDPFETTHFTDDPQYALKLAQLRQTFDSEWFPGY